MPRVFRGTIRNRGCDFTSAIQSGPPCGADSMRIMSALSAKGVPVLHKFHWSNRPFVAPFRQKPQTADRYIIPPAAPQINDAFENYRNCGSPARRMSMNSHTQKSGHTHEPPAVWKKVVHACVLHRNWFLLTVLFFPVILFKKIFSSYCRKGCGMEIRLKNELWSFCQPGNLCFPAHESSLRI